MDSANSDASELSRVTQGRAVVQPPALVIMGVAGCGKSSVGRACAERLGWRLVEGDDYHSAEAVAKMRNGTPLTDVDREGWLQRLGAILRSHARSDGAGVVLTCSALRRRYREQLRRAVPGVHFAFLDLSLDEAEVRVAARTDHLFPATLVASQFATLESPEGEAGVLRLDATAPIHLLAERIDIWLAGEDNAPG